MLNKKQGKLILYQKISKMNHHNVCNLLLIYKPTQRIYYWIELTLAIKSVPALASKRMNANFPSRSLMT
jgi:hypothetical protein